MERDARARCALVEFTRCVLLLLRVALLGVLLPRLVCGAPPGFPTASGSLQSKHWRMDLACHNLVLARANSCGVL